MTEAMEISLTTQALKSSQGSLLQLAAGHSAFPDVTSFLVVLHSLTPFVGIPTEKRRPWKYKKCTKVARSFLLRVHFGHIPWNPCNDVPLEDVWHVLVEVKQRQQWIFAYPYSAQLVGNGYSHQLSATLWQE